MIIRLLFFILIAVGIAGTTASLIYNLSIFFSECENNVGRSIDGN